jgi:hypothetical protein
VHDLKGHMQVQLGVFVLFLDPTLILYPLRGLVFITIKVILDSIRLDSLIGIEWVKC